MLVNVEQTFQFAHDLAKRSLMKPEQTGKFALHFWRRLIVTDLRYPVGKFEAKSGLTEAQIRELIESLNQAPLGLRAAVGGLTPQQLDTPYRPDGWTARQVVNHVADSHLNGYLRFKFALTEDEPVVKPYDEKLWADLEDGRTIEPQVSLHLLDALHLRWVTLLRSLDVKDFARRLTHPEWGKQPLEMFLQLYEWHGRHHTAHIMSLRQRKGW
jgi:hypothetical protein